ncbi:MAG: hypothetical protein LCH78_18080 [Proteobacteria bacterium]|nr:hypothetical protein [Pseudomonadota bacterium]
MSDNLDFLDGPSPADTTTADQTPAAAPEPSTDGPARGPDGRFAPREGEQPQAQPVAEQPALEPAKPEAQTVPLNVVKELRAEIRALKQQPQPQPQDYYPEELTPEEHVERATLNTRLDISEDMARDKFGDEIVDQARDWALEKFQNNPAYKTEVLSQRNPYRYIVEAYKADQRAARLNDLADDDIEAFLAWKSGQQAPQQAAPAAPPQQSAPPRSLASAPAAGGGKPGEQPVGPGVAFDALFTR